LTDGLNLHAFAAWIKAFFLFSSPWSDFPKNIPHDNPNSPSFLPKTQDDETLFAVEFIFADFFALK